MIEQEYCCESRTIAVSIVFTLPIIYNKTMKHVLIKTSIAITTLVLVALILLVSFERPVYMQRAELNVVSAYSAPDDDPSQLTKLATMTKPLLVSTYEQEPSMAQKALTPESFLMHYSEQDITKPQRVILSDEFLREYQQYQKERFKDYYAQKTNTLAIIDDVLQFMESAVGGHYIFGAQGDILTVKLIYDTNRIHPDYMNSGRLAYFVKNAVFQKLRRYAERAVSK